jgi:hypothetical protein
MLVGWLGSGATISLQAQPVEVFSCTAFPRNLSEVDLVTRYGEANVKRAPVTGSDDGPQEGVVVFDHTPRKLEIVWQGSNVAWVRSREPDSPWHTPDGISIGMDLRDLERRNGWPFRLRGLTGPEGLGRIRSWGRGRLRAISVDGCTLSISLQPSGELRIDPALYSQVSRGRDFSSGHPAMQAINPRVTSLIVAH